MSTQQIVVKWVYQQVKDKRGHALEAGQKPTICFSGRKYMLCLAMAYPIRVFKRPQGDFDRGRLVLQQGREYPVARAVEQFEGAVEKHGITMGARALLDRAAAVARGEEVAELREEDFQNEEDEAVKIGETPAPVAEGGEGTEAVAAAEGAATVKVKKARRMKQASTTKKETKTMVTKKKAAKVKAKSNGAGAKAKTNGAAATAKGAGGFRAGTKKEKAFMEFKGYHKEYAKLERGAKGEYAEKLAKKVGVEVTTVKSWIGGQFSAQLA